MQITLLPRLLPTEGVVAVKSPDMAFTPGMTVVATVLATNTAAGTLLSLAGRRLSTGTPLPHPPGTTLRFEVMSGGPRPRLQLVGVGAPDGPAGSEAAPRDQGATGPAVSAAGYGLAAAVVAARGGADVPAAAAAVAAWIPRLVALGLIGTAEGEQVRKALAPVPVQVRPPWSQEAGDAAASLARALAARVADGGLLLERRLADVIRAGRTDAGRALADDLRSRLAVLADGIRHAPPDVAGAGEAVRSLQDALLAEQARAAAHFARDGHVEVRIPLQAAPGGEVDALLKLRVNRDAPGSGSEADADPAPWRQATLDLAIEGLGHVHVRLGVTVAEVRAEFVVEAPDVADRIEARLADLAQTLGDAGFAHVLSRVAVDPVRASAPDDVPALPPLHSIVDARA